jgi:hypothetical protein
VWSQGDRRAVVVSLAERPGGLALCDSVRAFVTRARLAGSTDCSPGTVSLALIPAAPHPAAAPR